MQESLTTTLEQILLEAKQLIGQGKVAQYIPALAQVDPDQLGIAVCDVKGNLSFTGDATTPFSIQSISKVFTFTQALQLYADSIWQRVGREPSGQRFNSLMQLETESGIPRNPFINAGAILVCDMLESRCSAPNFQLLELLKGLAGNPAIGVDKKVALDELKHSARNAAMAYLMQSYHNFVNPVEKVLGSYVHHCAIAMSCVDLAKASIFLANQGVSLQGDKILNPSQSKQVNALLATCGLYDEAGDFAFRVGLPGKSGVGGGILAIYPGHCSICVWSPELNAAGNSLAGGYALELVTRALGISVY